MPRLEGAGIVLREFEQRDRPLVLSVVDDPLIPLVTSVPPEGGEAVAAAYIERQRSRLAEGVGYSFVIADGSTDEAVGQIGLWTRDAADGRVSIGYWVGPLFRRRGYAAAALGVLTSWASSLDGLHRLQLFVEPWNEGSWRAAEACGYEREGLLRGWQLVGGMPKDMYVYGLLTTVDRESQGA